MKIIPEFTFPSLHACGLFKQVDSPPGEAGSIASSQEPHILSIGNKALRFVASGSFLSILDYWSSFCHPSYLLSAECLLFLP